MLRMRIVLWDAPGKLRSYSPLKFFISPCVCTLARCARKLSLCAGPGHTWRLIKHARISQDSIKPHEKNSQTGYFRHRGQCREGSQRHRVKINVKYGHDQVPLYMTFCSRMPRPLTFIRPCIHFQWTEECLDQPGSPANLKEIKFIHIAWGRVFHSYATLVCQLTFWVKLIAWMHGSIVVRKACSL